MDSVTEQLIQRQPTPTASEVVQQLLGQHPTTEPLANSGTALAQRVLALERQAPELEQTVKNAGADIEHLGIAALPPGPMYYHGVDGAGWVMATAKTPEDSIVPKQQGQELRQIRAAGLYIPQIFVAHEIRPEQAERVRDHAPARGLPLEPAEAAELVGPVPPPAESVALGERMADRSRQIADGLRRTGNLIVRAVTIPAEAATTVLTETVMVDPIVLGAIPAASEQAGAPASWYRLVSWDW